MSLNLESMKYIVQMMQKDFRVSPLNIAKNLGITKNTAYKYIQETYTKLHIKNYVVINSSYLGLKNYGVLINIKDYSKIRSIIKAASVHPAVIITEKMIGTYNLRFNCQVKHTQELQDIIFQITNNFSQDISYITIYLISSDEKEIPLTDIETKILKSLCGTYNKSITDIAKEVNSTSPNIIYHLKNFEKRRIINKYSCTFDHTLLGLKRNICLIQTNASRKKIEMFSKILQEDYWTGFQLFTVSHFQFVFSFYTKTDSEMDTLFGLCDKIFKENYLNINLLQGMEFKRVRNITDSYWEKKHENTIPVRKKGK